MAEPIAMHCPLVDTSDSPHARLRPIGMDEVHLHDRFWKSRRDTNVRSTIPSQQEFLEQTFRLRNFDVASGRSPEKHAGQRYNDSDVYKWIEAAAWSLVDYPDAKLRRDIDLIVDRIAAAQDADGYVNSYFSGERRSERFNDLPEGHEIYCIGHLIQAAVALVRVSQNNNLMGIAIRAAQCLDREFGPTSRRGHGCCGHPVAEMALVELARETGERTWLTLARHMIDSRGKTPPIAGGRQYTQDHRPVVDQHTPVGHAVRQLYLASGVSDLLMETEDPGLDSANHSLWENFVSRKMLVTGGAGSRWDGEAFGDDWELPSDRCYAESCAAIATAQWHHRQWLHRGDVRYADALEWTWINAVLPGISVDGLQYFYQNPLADRGSHRRREWFGCACCPPNLSRMLSSFTGMVAASDESTIQIGLIADMTIETSDARVKLTTEYPWDGVIRVQAEGDVRRVDLRIPGWASVATRDGKPIAPGWCRLPLSGGRLDTTIVLPMWVRRVHAHPRVHAARGQVALHRGPVLYCAEACDQSSRDPYDFGIGRQPDWITVPRQIHDLEYRAMQGRVAVVPDIACVPWDSRTAEGYSECDAELVPYFLWANRQPGPMTVWMHDLQ